MTTTETNNIVHKVETTDNNGNQLQIVIRLNDECKNGHNDFSITGTLWEKGKPRTDRYLIRAGAMGDSIAKWHPKYQIFEDLHLCDAKGAPMYAQANGFFHLKEGKKDYLISHYQFTEEEYNQLKANAEDQLYFQYLIESFKIPERWEAKAKKAIALLEKWTGKKFKDDSVRYQYTPLTMEELTLIGERINTGYYTPAALAQRAKEKIEVALQKEFDRIKAKRDETVAEENTQYEIKHAILTCGLHLDNFIYYAHINTGVFNWRDTPYRKPTTNEQFDHFIQAADYSKMPEGIKFEIKIQ